MLRYSRITQLLSNELSCATFPPTSGPYRLFQICRTRAGGGFKPWYESRCVFLTRGSATSMLYHRIEAQPLGSWLTWEITTTGREVVYKMTKTLKSSETQKQCLQTTMQPHRLTRNPMYICVYFILKN